MNVAASQIKPSLFLPESQVCIYKTKFHIKTHTENYQFRVIPTLEVYTDCIYVIVVILEYMDWSSTKTT